MRTTLNLDEDVAQRVDQEARRRGKSAKVVINEALRVGLGLVDKPRSLPPFRVEAQALALQPGIDPDKLNQLVDELEAISERAELRST